MLVNPPSTSTLLESCVVAVLCSGASIGETGNRNSSAYLLLSRMTGCNGIWLSAIVLIQPDDVYLSYVRPRQ